MVKRSPKETMLTARQVAQFLQVHVSTIRRWSDQGILKTYRIGNRGDRRYKWKDVLKFIESRNGNAHQSITRDFSSQEILDKSFS